LARECIGPASQGASSPRHCDPLLRATECGPLAGNWIHRGTRQYRAIEMAGSYLSCGACGLSEQRGAQAVSLAVQIGPRQFFIVVCQHGLPSGHMTSYPFWPSRWRVGHSPGFPTGRSLLTVPNRILAVLAVAPVCSGYRRSPGSDRFTDLLDSFYYAAPSRGSPLRTARAHFLERLRLAIRSTPRTCWPHLTRKPTSHAGHR